MKWFAQKERRHLLGLVSEENESSPPCNTIPCDEVADRTASDFGELSCAFDFAESIPRDLNNRPKLLFEDPFSAMASASAFDWGLFAANRMTVR